MQKRHSGDGEHCKKFLTTVRDNNPPAVSPPPSSQPPSVAHVPALALSVTCMQALQTLMARQRVAYDFEYFRCGCSGLLC